MKKIINILLTILVIFTLTGCKEKKIEGKLTDIMDTLYEGIDKNELPMMLETHELTNDNLENYAFTKNIKYKEAIFSESMVGSIPHSVVLIRLENANDATKVVNEIKEKADPRKWICVEAENVYVESKDDLVILIMSNELAPKIKANFEKLGK